MSRYRRPYGRHHRRTRKSYAGSFRSILLTIFLFSVLGMLVVWLQKQTPPGEAMNGTVYVIDGDTVIMDKTHIRLKGMDAPEMEQQCERAGRNYDCGREARNILRAKIGKSAIRCDKEGRDQYMRELSRCYLGETELNRWMVEQGWAVSYGDYQHEEAMPAAIGGAYGMAGSSNPRSGARNIAIRKTTGCSITRSRTM